MNTGFLIPQSGHIVEQHFLEGVLEKKQIYKRMAIQVFMQIKDHVQQV